MASKLLEKWHQLCDDAREALERYNENPSPENQRELEKALYQRHLIEQEMEPDCSQKV